MQIKYNILVIGTNNVGKTLFINNFKKSNEYITSGIDIDFTESNIIMDHTTEHTTKKYDFIFIVCDIGNCIDWSQYWKTRVINTFKNTTFKIILTKCDLYYHNIFPDNRSLNWDNVFLYSGINNIGSHFRWNNTESDNYTVVPTSKEFTFNKILKVVRFKKALSNPIGDVVQGMKTELLNSHNEIIDLKNKLSTLKDKLKQMVS